MEINIDWFIILKSSEQVFIWTLQILERHSVVGVGLLFGSDNN